jgi:excisionase family DNA binding protein
MTRRTSQATKIPAQATASTPDTSTAVSDRLLLTVEEAGAALGVGRSLMYEFIARGEIRTVRVGRLRRVRPEDLRAFVSSLSVT